MNKIAHNIVLACVALLTFQSCSQPTPVNQNPNITADNFVEEITKQVKHYPSEKVYKIRYSNDNCYFEMFVDGIRVHKLFVRGGSTAIEVSDLLFHSGKHTISYKMFPLYTLEEEDTTITQNTLVNNSYVTLELCSYDLKNEDAEDISYAKYGTPNIAIKNAQGDTIYKFAGAGKTYYEGSFEVELEVPYQLQPSFATAQDLRKMDQKLLMTKLLAKYKEVWQIYKNRELDNIARLEYDSLKDLFISHYATPKTIKENWAVIYDNYKNGTFEIQPIENYKLEFFADGKLAALMLDTKDNKIRGNTVLWAKLIYENGEFGMPVFFNRYFYIPQGETEFKVY
ncbi:hypothetical protein [Capnocytophaga sputigena]|uniref:hypothetical protein n=1 Tax=Capnocytophaga sputigena TaxID=1019 RepID=UPI00288BE7C1|nr:hypothetical protein [Capnocytophaga sputigena]